MGRSGGGVDRPGTVGAVDKEGQPGSGVLAKLYERTHHRDAGAIVDGEGQLISVPGQRREHTRRCGYSTSRGIFHRIGTAAARRSPACSRQ
jgi:hypothetical protein